MKNRYLPILFVALIFRTSGVKAQTAGQNDIRELITLSGGTNLEALRDLWWFSIEQQAGKELPQDFKDKLWKEFLNESRPGELLNRLVPVYEKYVAPQDIEEIVEFYDSQVGRRFVAAESRVAVDIRRSPPERSQKPESGQSNETAENVAELFAQYLTDEELAALNRFFGSPAGGRFKEAKSKIDVEATPVSAQWRTETLQRASVKLDPYVRGFAGTNRVHR